MKRTTTISMMLLLLLTSITVYAQSGIVTGVVTDTDSQPVIGAVVTATGAQNYVVTDDKGAYSIDPGTAKTLEFSFYSMKTQAIEINGRAVINVTLEPEDYFIRESTVVSVGYGAVAKKDLTGSIASVKGDVLNSFSQEGVTQALQGRIAGVQVSSISAEPGASHMIRIRGTSSIKGGNDPLWIVDGFVGQQAMLNTADIESVEVLKDASATAIYGSRGSNGVIIVTTKTPKEGKVSVEYRGSESVNFLEKKLPLMNGGEWMEYQNIIAKSEVFNPGKIKDMYETGGTDWQDEIFRPSMTHDHSISIVGGTSKVKVSSGISYMCQNGLVKGSGYQKISARNKVEFDVNHWLSINTNIIYTYTIHDKQNITGSILKGDPTLVPYDENGDYSSSRLHYSFSASGLHNPYALINERSFRFTSNRTMANIAFNFKPIDGLVIRLSANVNTNDGRQGDYITNKMPESQSSAEVTNSRVMRILTDNTITYTKKIKNHNFSVMGGVTYEQYENGSFKQQGSNFKTDIAGIYSVPSAEKELQFVKSSYSKWTLFSFLGRINYNYANKYYATVNFRADGSSRYSVGNKWGAFPSGALAWRISDEPWMKNVKCIDNLKLRTSFGISGNAAIDPYTTLDLLSPSTIVFNKQEINIYESSKYYKFGLVWETTRQTDVGIDLSMFKSRLNLTLDYYYRNTYNLLNTVELPGSSGYVSGTKNVGTMHNSGVDIQLDGRVLNKKDWTIDLGLNLSVNRNKVVELPDHTDVYGESQSITIMKDYINLLREGEPIGVFYGYREAGYDDKGHLVYYASDGSVTATPNANDKAIIGDPNPKFTYGFNLDVRMWRFALSAFFNGSVGNDIYSLAMASTNYNYSGGRAYNAFKEVLTNHWTPETPNAKYPALESASTTSLRMSDRFVYDGSYLKLRNVELSYSIDFSKVKTITSGMVYISAQNVFTLTKYPFFSPDVNSYGGSSSVNQGIDNIEYPEARSVTLGVRFKF